MPTATLFERIGHWYHRSLANTIATQATLIALASTLFVILVSFAILYWSEVNTQNEQMQTKANRVAEHIDDTIRIVSSSAHDLAQSPMFMTALLDSKGRDVYVAPFVENYRFPVTETSGLALCDINGQLLAKTRSALSDCRTQTPQFHAVAQGEKIQWELLTLPNGHLVWVEYQGVIFNYTDTVEGVVVAHIDLHDTLHDIQKDIDLEMVALNYKDNQLDAARSDNLVTVGQTNFHATANLAEEYNPSSKRPRLSVSIADDNSPFAKKLYPLIIGYSVGTFVLVMLVISLSRRAAQRLTGPLSSLTMAAKNIAESGDKTLPISTTDVGEVGQLGRAFDVMVRTLQVAEASLENKVLQRTNALLQSEEALRQSQRHLQTIFNILPVGLTLTDADGNIVDCNVASERLLGISRAEHLGRSYDDSGWAIYRPDGSVMPADEYASVKALSEQRTIQDVTMEVRRPKLGSVWLNVSAAPLGPPSNGVVVAYADISAYKMVEGKLNEAATIAQSANVAKSQFLATMSHELRTPLNGILGMAQLLLMQNINESERAEYTRTILNSGNSLLILLNDILDLSKIEAGKIQLAVTATDPEQLMRDTQNLLRGTAESKGLALTSSWHGLPGQRFLLDPNRVRQMLTNLVSNAVKFTEIGSVLLEGGLMDAGEKKQTLEFSVSDTGIGIPADKQGFLFEPFYQVDSSTTRQYSGTGLGLSIVRNLAQLMGGSVGVSSTAGSGARFWFRIPGISVMGAVESRRHPRSPPAHGTIANATRVLIVEDKPANCDVVIAILHKLGIETSIANDGQQAVDMVTHASLPNLPDAILMDLHMPVMDGYEAARQIRRWEIEYDVRRIPIVALTADAFAAVRDRCRDAGIDDVLTKPIVISQLENTLAKFLPADKKIPDVKAPAAKPLKAVDEGHLNELLDAIAPLLAAHRFDAFSVLAKLQELATNSALEAEMKQISELLHACDYERTSERLNQLRRSSS